MDMTRFQLLLDAYGADPGRWPAAERAAAEALLAADPTAQAARREALALDAALDLLPTPPVPADLAARIAAAAPLRTPRPANSNRPWPMAMALAASAALGLWLGVAAGPWAGDAAAGDFASLDRQEVAMLAFGPTLDEE